MVFDTKYVYCRINDWLSLLEICKGEPLGILEPIHTLSVHYPYLSTPGYGPKRTKCSYFPMIIYDVPPIKKNNLFVILN